MEEVPSLYPPAQSNQEAHLVPTATILTGPANYFGWKRSFQVLAEYHGISHVFESSPQAHVFTTIHDNYYGMCLLKFTTHASIYELFKYEGTARFAYDWIKARYENGYTRMLLDAHWNALHLGNCKDLQDLVLRMKEIALDRYDALIYVTDADMVHKLLTSLGMVFYLEYIQPFEPDLVALSYRPFEEVTLRLLLAEAKSRAVHTSLLS